MPLPQHYSGHSQSTGPTVRQSQSTGPTVGHSQSTGPTLGHSQSTGPTVGHNQSTGPTVGHSQSTGPTVGHSQSTGPTVMTSDLGYRTSGDYTLRIFTIYSALDLFYYTIRTRINCAILYDLTFSPYANKTYSKIIQISN